MDDHNNTGGSNWYVYECDQTHSAASTKYPPYPTHASNTIPKTIEVNGEEVRESAFETRSIRALFPKASAFGLYCKLKAIVSKVLAHCRLPFYYSSCYCGLEPFPCFITSGEKYGDWMIINPTMFMLT